MHMNKYVKLPDPTCSDDPMFLFVVIVLSAYNFFLFFIVLRSYCY